MDPKIVVNGKEYPFVLESDLTLGEAAEVERITGQGYDLSKVGALGLLALTYISIKRHDANVRVEDIETLTAPDIDLKVDGKPLPPDKPADSSELGGTSGASSKDDSAPFPAHTPEFSGTPV